MTLSDAYFNTFKQEMVIHDFHIINKHLCAIHQIIGEDFSVSAIPLSLILQSRGTGEKSRARDMYSSVRSQDLFRPFKVTIPNTSPAAGATGDIEHISICTSSWRAASTCENDAPATPTRILLSLPIRTTDHDNNCMVAELLLSPMSANPSSRSSPSSTTDDSPQNGYLLTYERQSLGCTRRQDALGLMTTSRTGHMLVTYFDYSTSVDAKMRHHYTFLLPISMVEVLKGKFSSKSNDADRDEHIMGQEGHSNRIGGVLGDVVGEGSEVKLEEYSSAIWYRSCSKLFIHFTD